MILLRSLTSSFIALKIFPQNFNTIKSKSCETILTTIQCLFLLLLTNIYLYFYSDPLSRELLLIFFNTYTLLRLQQHCSQYVYHFRFHIYLYIHIFDTQNCWLLLACLYISALIVAHYTHSTIPLYSFVHMDTNHLDLPSSW